MAAFSTAMSAQDMEQTMPPRAEGGGGYYVWQQVQEDDYSKFIVSSYTTVSFENTDEAEATIYYRHNMGDSFTDWREYIIGDPIYNSGLGESVVEAYAVADGKLPSEIVSANVYYHDMDLYEAFLVDGIHYYYQFDPWNWDWEQPNNKVSVCSPKESNLISEPYSGNIIIPDEVVFRYTPSVVAGIRDAAFASTFACTCEITSVELPSTIESIGRSSFGGCIKLERMTIHAVNPPSADELFSDQYIPDTYNYYDIIGFNGNTLYSQVTLFVPNESLEDYKAHQEWGKFTHIVPFIGAGPGDINGDGNIAISDATELVDMLLNGDELPAWGDVNGDGNVTVLDVTDMIDLLMNNN